MPYASAPGRAPLTRVYDRHNAGHRKSMKTTDAETIREAQAMLDRFRRQRRWDVLDAIIAEDATIPEVYDADRHGTLLVLLAQIAERRAAQHAIDADPDLDKSVTAWAASGANAKYVKQVRRLIPTGRRFPLSDFRRKTLAKFLRELTNQRTGKAANLETRKRHRVALSMFAKRLIEDELIEHNPTRDIDLGRHKGPRPIRYLEAAQVKLLVEALPEGEQRTLEAVMAGCGLEWSATKPLRRRDIEFNTRIIYAAGTKNGYRNRYVECSEDWAWQIIEAHCRRLLPNARLFPKLREEDALTTHHETAKALELPHTTLHNHRNSYAVMHINLSKGDAEKLQWLKNQLGHAPQSTLIYTRYGVQIKAAKLTASQQERLGRKVEGA